MNFTKSTIAVLIAGAVPFAAMAQSSTPNMYEHNVYQQQRIEQGLRDGSLTVQEAANLERGQSRIDRMESRAAADGRVVYAGSSLRGYGNLVILKHNNTYLTAYAHNQTLLIKEDQPVRKGQKIAEMGSSDADRVKLHFEIRRQGKPVDPTKYLPAR